MKFDGLCLFVFLFGVLEFIQVILFEEHFDRTVGFVVKHTILTFYTDCDFVMGHGQVKILHDLYICCHILLHCVYDVIFQVVLCKVSIQIVQQSLVTRDGTIRQSMFQGLIRLNWLTGSVLLFVAFSFLIVCTWTAFVSSSVHIKLISFVNCVLVELFAIRGYFQ